MKVLATDEYPDDSGAAIADYVQLETLLERSDVISLHCPLTPATEGLIRKETIAKMKDGVYVVNTARGGIYNLEALAEAIRSGKVAGAGIDVYEKEPCTSSPLHELDQVVLTPHLGASTKEAQARAGQQIAEYVLMGLEGKMVPTAVNVALVPDDVMTAVKPFIEASQTTGVILAQLAEKPIESLAVKVYGDLAKNDVSLLGTAALRGIFSRSSDDPVNFVNANYLAEQRGVSVRFETSTVRSEYASKVSFEVLAGSQLIEVSITTSGPDEDLRIVSLLGYKLDLIPGKNLLIQKYADKPGQIGLIGTILGKANINISTMQVGVREETAGVALILMNVDEAIPASICAEVKEAVGVTEGWFIQL
jgi:D-3-phosphoglycerate dehydrogenase